MRTQENVIIEDDFICIRLKNESNNVQVITKDLTSDVMQFHFVLKGKGNFVFNNGDYTMPVKEENGLTLYNPQRGLPINLEVQPNSWIIRSEERRVGKECRSR